MLLACLAEKYVICMCSGKLVHMHSLIRTVKVYIDNNLVLQMCQVWASVLNGFTGMACLYLTLKAPITTAADDIHKYFFIVFQRK